MKNKSCKIVALIIAVAIFITPVISFALPNKVEEEATLLQEGEYKLDSLSDSVKSILSATNIESYIYTQLKACSTEFTISSYNINVNDIGALYSNVINDNPDLFYVSSSFVYYYTSRNIVSKIIPHYANDLTHIEADKAIFDYGAAQALDRVDSSMSELQKALVIHDYICDLATYPALSSEGSTTDDLDRDIYHSAFRIVL